MKIITACIAFLSFSVSIDTVLGDVPLKRLQFSRYDDGVVIRRLHDVSLEDCVKECGLRSSCVGLNYQRMMTLCELLSSVGTPTIKRAWVYLQMRDNVRQRIMAKHCGDRANCAAGQKCSKRANVPVPEYTCKIEECGEINEPISQMFPARINMLHNISARIKVSHAPKEPLYDLQCCPDGTWNTVCGGTTSNPYTPPITTTTPSTTSSQPPTTTSSIPPTKTPTQPPTTTSDSADLTPAGPLDWISMGSKEIGFWRLDPQDWKTAMWRCQQEGGTLAKFNNVDEMKSLPPSDDTPDGMWLGGKADTNSRAWAWVEKDPDTDQYITTQLIGDDFWFARDLPVPEINENMCILMHKEVVSPGDAGEYNLQTAPCDDAMMFMCERTVAETSFNS